MIPLGTLEIDGELIPLEFKVRLTDVYAENHEALASASLNANGELLVISASGGITRANEWGHPRKIDIGENYEARIVPISGTINQGENTGEWLPINTIRAWGVQADPTTHEFKGTLEIRPLGGVVIASANVTFISTSSIMANKVFIMTAGSDPYVHAWITDSAGHADKLPGPAVIPGGGGREIEFTPSEKAVIMGHASSPYIAAYKWSDSGFGDKYANPAASLGGTVMSSAISPNNDYVFVNPQYGTVTALEWNDETGFGAVADTASVDTGATANELVINSTNTTVVSSANDSPYIYALPWENGAFGIPYDNLSPAITAQPSVIVFSPSSKALILSDSGLGTKVNAWAWDDATGFGTKYADPADPPVAAITGAAFNIYGTVLFVSTGSTAPYIEAYEWDDETGFGAKYPAAPYIESPLASPKEVRCAVDNSLVFMQRICWQWDDETGFGAGTTVAGQFPGSPYGINVAGTGPGEVITLTMVEEDTLTSTSFEQPQSSAISGNHAFILSTTSGTNSSCTAVDISDQLNMVEVATLVLSDGAAQHITIVGNYAFITIGPDSVNHIIVVDISDPLNMAEVEIFTGSLLSGADLIETSGDYAFVTPVNSSYFTSVNISDPLNLVEAGTIDTGSSYAFAVSGNHVFIATTGHAITSIDVSDPSNMVEVGSFTSVNIEDIRGISASGNYIFVTSITTDTIAVLDVSDPTALVEVEVLTHADMDAPGKSVISNGYIFVSDSSTRIIAADISDPLALKHVDTLDLSIADTYLWLTLSGNYIYVTGQEADSVISVDISDFTV